MYKELYIIHYKLEDDENWRFLGAFKSSTEANSYYNNYHYDKIPRTTIPWDLPEKWSTYFDKFIYCEECDKFQHDVENRSVYLVQKNHNGEWHFECLLPTMKQSKHYVNKQDENDQELRIIHLKLPYPKDKIYDKVRLERSKLRKENEKKYNDKKEKEERIEKEAELDERHDMFLKVIIGLSVVNLVTNVIQFFY